MPHGILVRDGSDFKSPDSGRRSPQAIDMLPQSRTAAPFQDDSLLGRLSSGIPLEACGTRASTEMPDRRPPESMTERAKRPWTRSVEKSFEGSSLVRRARSVYSAIVK
jgi:hypothetical protein